MFPPSWIYWRKFSFIFFIQILFLFSSWINSSPAKCSTGHHRLSLPEGSDITPVQLKTTTLSCRMFHTLHQAWPIKSQVSPQPDWLCGGDGCEGIWNNRKLLSLKHVGHKERSCRDSVGLWFSEKYFQPQQTLWPGECSCPDIRLHIPSVYPDCSVDPVTQISPWAQEKKQRRADRSLPAHSE